jgi:hypothetical protein
MSSVYYGATTGFDKMAMVYKMQVVKNNLFRIQRVAKTLFINSASVNVVFRSIRVHHALGYAAPSCQEML